MGNKSQFNAHQFNTQMWNTEIPIIGIFNESVSLSDDYAITYGKVLSDFVFNTDDVVSEWTEVIRQDEIKLADWLTIKRINKADWSD